MKVAVGILKAIDRAFYLRNQISILEAEKKELTDTIKKYMKDNDLKTVEAQEAQAEYGVREPTIIHPEEYLEALDGDLDKLLASVTVRINQTGEQKGARSYLGEEELEAISDFSEIPTLRLTRRKETTKEEAPKKIVTPRPRNRRVASART